MSELAAAQARIAEIERAAELPNCNASHATIADYTEELRAHAMHLAAENLRLREDAKLVCRDYVSEMPDFNWADYGLADIEDATDGDTLMAAMRRIMGISAARKA